MKTIIKSLLLGLISLSLFSCVANEIKENSTTESKITFSVDNFIPADGVSRSMVDPTNNYAVTWASGDVIGIFPREGYQEPFSIPADQVGLSKATFDGGYWSMKEGLTYNAYYPFDKANFESAECKTNIPVTYLGQNQTSNVCNAGAFDYTYSDWTESVAGSVNFKFHHIGAFLVITLKLPATATYTSVSLIANSAIIPTKGTYDLTATIPTFVASESAKASSLTMSLNNFSGTAGEDAVFYMMMPPCNLNSATLMAKLSTNSTSCYYDLESMNIEAAHLYRIAGTPKESSVDGTIDGWVTEEKTYENGHEYVDLGIIVDGKKIMWATTNIGADNPEDYGELFSWGELETKENYYWTYYTYKINGGSYGYEYIGNDISNTEYDVAHYKWGGNWRMPNNLELQALIDNCTWDWYSSDEKKGYKITSNSNGKSIFLPAAGYNFETDPHCSGTSGYYHSSCQIIGYNNTYDYQLTFNSEKKLIFETGCRYYGESIRPILWK